MRIGIFLGQDHHNSTLTEIISGLGDEVVGYSAIKPISYFSGKIKYEPYPLELLAGCDAAIVFPSEGVWAEVPKAAIRRGINLYLADLPSYSRQELLEMQHLLEEIKIVVEFGFSGFNLDQQIQNFSLLDDSIYLDIHREYSTSASFYQMKRSLVFDLATILRLKRVSIRKVKVFSLPMQSQDYGLLNVRIDLANGNLFNYTISRLGNADSFVFNLYAGVSKQKISVDTSDFDFNIGEGIETKSISEFFQLVRYGGESRFSVDKAIELYSLIEEVNEKLAVYNS